MKYCERCRTGSQYADGSCKACYCDEVIGAFEELRSDPQAPTSGANAPDGWYFSGIACPHGKHPQKLSTTHRGCVACYGPRKTARLNGSARYMPDHACASCGLVAEKNTRSGRCYGCNPDASPGRQPDPAIVALMSTDALLTPSAARAIGSKIYRTGNTCKNGHTSWRYVNGGACLACLGRIKINKTP